MTVFSISTSPPHADSGAGSSSSYGSSRRAKKDDQVDQRTGKWVQIIIDGKDNYQLDGDVVGESTILTAEINQVPWQSAPQRPRRTATIILAA